MTDILLRVLIQSTIAVLAVALICALLRNLSPNTRCWLWRLVYIKCLLVFMLSASVVVPIYTKNMPSEIVYLTKNTANIPVGATNFKTEAVNIPVEAANIPIEATNFKTDEENISSTVVNMTLVVCILYLIGAVIGVSRIVFSIVRSVSLLKLAKTVSHPEIFGLVTCFGLRRAPRVARVPGLESPLLTFGVILLPEPAIDGERLILAHELAHAKRHDLLWEVLGALVGVLLWFHPLVYLARREEKLAREQAADALAVKRAEAPLAEYARLLLNATLSRTPALAVGAFGNPSRLRLRLEALARPTLPRRAAVALTLLAAVLALPALIPWRAVARQNSPVSPSVMPSGRVRSRDGKPVANALVRLMDGVGPTLLATTRTEADGTFRFPAKPAKWPMLLVEAPGFGPAERNCSRTQRDVTITLEPALRWEAIVTDEKGHAIPGLKIRAHSGRLMNSLYPKRYEGVTDSQGRFSMDKMPSFGHLQKYPFTIDDSSFTIARMTPYQKDNLIEVRLVLTGGRYFSGSVVNQLGKPMPGAIVQFKSYKISSYSMEEAVTNANGFFESPILPPGDYDIDIDGNSSVLAPTYVSTVTLGSGNHAGLRFVLTPGVTVRGRVVKGNTRKPLAKVSVLVVRQWNDINNGISGSESLGPGGQTDAQGNYEVHLPVGQRCSVSVQGSRPQQFMGKEGDVFTADFALRKSSRVPLDAFSGEPIVRGH